MDKWLIPAFLLVMISAYTSSMVFNSLGNPTLCADCHEKEYKNFLSPINNSDLPAHKGKNITCIECHSPQGIEGNLGAKKIILNFLIINKLSPLIHGLFDSNQTERSLNLSDFSILKANCIKCHYIKKIQSDRFNHSNASECESCHLMHKETPISQEHGVSFWKRLEEGGHRNRTCAECHGTDPTRLEDLPQCTKCHIPHIKDAQWDRSVCLGCHDDPHVPVKDAVFKGDITKDMCAACHGRILKVLSLYDSKHYQKVPACITCHPAHREALSCGDCHNPHGYFHAGSKCYECHRYLSNCRDCHVNPHAPLSGLPRISGGWEEFSKQISIKRKSQS